jgi:hypothetical protein
MGFVGIRRETGRPRVLISNGLAYQRCQGICTPLAMSFTPCQVVTYVSFTPQRFVVRRMMASITSEDMSWPAELAGKLYSRIGIFHHLYRELQRT